MHFDFYYYRSPNSQRVMMVLDKLNKLYPGEGPTYDVKHIDLRKGDKVDMLYSPKGYCPALFDTNGSRYFESGAIILRLCEIFDVNGALLPLDDTNPHAKRSEALSWFFNITADFAMKLQGLIIPAIHAKKDEKSQVAEFLIQTIKDTLKEFAEFYNDRLEETGSYIMDSPHPTICDLSLMPLLHTFLTMDMLEINFSIEDYEYLNTWYKRMLENSSVQKTLAFK